MFSSVISSLKGVPVRDRTRTREELLLGEQTSWHWLGSAALIREDSPSEGKGRRPRTAVQTRLKRTARTANMADINSPL